MLETIVNCKSMEWQEAGKGYPSGTKIKALRDDDGGRTVILLLPKGFIMEGHSHIYSEQPFFLKASMKSGKKYTARELISSFIPIRPMGLLHQRPAPRFW